MHSTSTWRGREGEFIEESAGAGGDWGWQADISGYYAGEYSAISLDAYLLKGLLEVNNSRLYLYGDIGSVYWNGPDNPNRFFFLNAGFGIGIETILDDSVSLNLSCGPEFHQFYNGTGVNLVPEIGVFFHF